MKDKILAWLQLVQQNEEAWAWGLFAAIVLILLICIMGG